MILGLKRWLEQALEDEQDDKGHRIELATAALLMEVSRADAEKSHLEWSRIEAILHRTFHLGDEELAELVRRADETTEDAHDLFAFTSVINDHLDYDGRVVLMHKLWEVAYADGRLDTFEEHIIRRIAGLLHIAHHDFIRTRMTVRDNTP